VEHFSTDAAIQRYLPLMHELAIRIELIAHASDGKLNLTPPFAREYAYLQFRRICELTALGCLLLHGDLPSTQTKSAQKEWNAEKIMKRLHNNFPHSFPQSVTRELTPKGWNIQANSKPNALTLDEFKKLYSECGEVLHRGTIRSLETVGSITQSDYQKVTDWQSKLVALMNEHLIARAHGKGLYIISLRTESGFPECSILTPNASGGLNIDIRKMMITSKST
jgi:hypothetical protein